MTLYLDEMNGSRAAAKPSVVSVTQPNGAGVYRNIFKRVLDFAFVVIVLPFSLPVMVGLALVIARDGHNPFFWNVRVGKGGKTFKMLKFRTMVPGAERLLAEHLAADPSAREEWDATQKLKCDPRITSFGRFLRKTSVDELPQLWNVLIGEMSLVGPRPMLPEQREMYPGAAYFFMRPGITGMWQVSDRNDVEFARRADFDKEYSENMSFFSDIGLLAKTFKVVLKGTGY